MGILLGMGGMERAGAGSIIGLPDPVVDTDGDGRPDWLEHALGTDPEAADAGTGVELLGVGGADGSGTVRIAFVRRTERAGLSYAPEFSNDLREWTALPVRVESVTAIDADLERVVGRVVSVEGRAPGRFVRLRVGFRPVGGSFGEEGEARDAFHAAPIAFEGRVVDVAGVPVAGALVTADPDVTVEGDEVAALTGGDGGFRFEDLERRNVLVSVEAPGFRREVVPVHLHVATEVTRRVLAPIRLVAHDPSEVRFLFAGDTSFGRRFVNPVATSEPDDPDRIALPADHPEAFIRVSDPLPGAVRCVAFVEPLFATADYPIVNLESPVLRDPATPHLDKSYAFYTLPETLGALRRLGVDYVSLGNNHTFDYLEAGVRDTLAYVAAAGLAQSGLGVDAASAIRPFVQALGGREYALVSACSVSGTQNPPLYVASDSQGGAADLRDDALMRAAIGEAAGLGRVVIAQLHTGKEYSRIPSDYALGRMHLAVDAGADLVVGHHPHVAQGFELHRGVLMIHCLGNFLFDQQRLETLLGLVVQVDLRGAVATRATAFPVYLEDYRPRLITGALADRFLRRIAAVSPLPVIPDHGLGRVALSDADFREEARTLSVPLEIGAEGVAVVDLRRWLDSDESLASLAAPGAGLSARLGRDLLLFGGMEESDIDDEGTDGEASRWWRAGGAYRGHDHPFAGAVALYSTGSRRMPEVVASFSVTADGVELADGHTLVNEAEIAVFDAPGGTFALRHEGAAGFGGAAFFERLGNPPGEPVDIDALFLHDDGRVSFSTTTDFRTTRLGIVKDGSVATFDPAVPPDDSGSLILLLDEDGLFPDLPGGGNNNQDIDALHIDAQGRIYFSTTADARLGGSESPGLDIRNGDVVRYDPATGGAEIFLREEDLFTEDADLTALSFTPEGAPVFSVAETVGLAGSGDRLVDGAIGIHHAASGTTATYLLQADLFAVPAGAWADLGALHLAAHPDPPPRTDPPPQIAFRNRIRVEGDPDNTPNKDLTALGYLWLENNGPMAVEAGYQASFGDLGPETFGSEILVEHPGGGTAPWRFFARDLAMPPDDPDAGWPEADNARAVRFVLRHEAPADGRGLVGLDELALVSWEVDRDGARVTHDLDTAVVIPGLHDRDFIRVEGPPGIYALEIEARRLVPQPR